MDREPVKLGLEHLLVALIEKNGGTVRLTEGELDAAWKNMTEPEDIYVGRLHVAGFRVQVDESGTMEKTYRLSIVPTVQDSIR